MFIFCLTFFQLFFLSFGEHPVFGKFSEIISNADSVEVFSVAENPVAENLQKKDKVYLSDYEVLRQIKISENEKDSLVKAVLSEGNFSADKKMCPTKGAMIFRFVKKKKFVHFLLSTQNCKKAVIFSSEKKINKQYFDLKEENSLHALQFKESAN